MTAPPITGDLTLAGPTPVLYYDPEDAASDGRGYNVLLANSAFVDRFAKLVDAVDAFQDLLPLGRPE